MECSDVAIVSEHAPASLSSGIEMKMLVEISWQHTYLWQTQASGPRR
jgi:hypothetical protein